MRNQRLTEQEASEYLSEKHRLGRTPKTLASLRSQNRGPRYFKNGRDVFYTPADLDQYGEGIPHDTRDSLAVTESPDKSCLAPNLGGKRV